MDWRRGRFDVGFSFRIGHLMAAVVRHNLCCVSGCGQEIAPVFRLNYSRLRHAGLK